MRKKITIFTFPYNEGCSFRCGYDEAPDYILKMWEEVEDFSPVWERDWSECFYEEVHNWGDGSKIESPFVVLGGNHLITVEVVKHLHRVYPELFVLILDAHFDLRESFNGQIWNHACVSHLIGKEIGLQNVAILGVRSGTKEEFEKAKDLSIYGDLKSFIIKAPPLPERPVYLSIDMDVFDPSIAPGVGNPEPRGWTYHNFLDFLRVILHYDVVGFDISEVIPKYDPSGITGILAGNIIKDVSLAVWR